jgi:hypothetical protein
MTIIWVDPGSSDAMRSGMVVAAVALTTGAGLGAEAGLAAGVVTTAGVVAVEVVTEAPTVALAEAATRADDPEARGMGVEPAPARTAAKATAAAVSRTSAPTAPATIRFDRLSRS